MYMFTKITLFKNSRGQYSIIVKAMNSTNRKLVVAKLMETNATTEPEINHEFDILKTLRHERIAYLIEAFKLVRYSIISTVNFS